jgi:hypothetical protein
MGLSERRERKEGKIKAKEIFFNFKTKNVGWGLILNLI